MRLEVTSSFVLCLLSGILFFCSQTETKADKVREFSKEIPIEVSVDSVTAYWDAPDSSSNGGRFAFYEFYYRPVTQTGWTLLYGGIPESDSPHVVVHKKDLGGSGNLFYFAVRGVMADSTKSPFHASFDSTAGQSPWYVRWVK